MRVSDCEDGALEYRFDATTGQIVSSSGKCASVSVASPGYPVLLTACDASDPLQRFSFDNSSGMISMPAAGGSGPLCVDAGSTASCSIAPFSGYPYCNSSMDAADRAADLAARLTAEEWANLLYSGNAGVW